jgi:hypothetical protein
MCKLGQVTALWHNTTLSHHALLSSPLLCEEQQQLTCLFVWTKSQLKCTRNHEVSHYTLKQCPFFTPKLLCHPQHAGSLHLHPYRGPESAGLERGNSSMSFSHSHVKQYSGLIFAISRTSRYTFRLWMTSNGTAGTDRRIFWYESAKSESPLIITMHATRKPW